MAGKHRRDRISHSPRTDEKLSEVGKLAIGTVIAAVTRELASRLLELLR
ncbi:hypothetical protein [Nocardia suismassiliense]|nr:hypothetical protein [Nocardia suismassiliense]